HDSDDAAREYGRHLAMDGLLESVLKNGQGAGQGRKTRRRLILVGLGAAAALLLGIAGYFIRVAPADRDVIATVELVLGKAYLVSDSGKVALKGGETVAPGQGLETGSGLSRLNLLYPDGTRVTLSSNTILKGL